jgi:hypothetical protein
MSIYGGPDIETDGLTLHLDVANTKSFSQSETLAVECMIVAGGGGGGGYAYAGGGGAGGLLYGLVEVSGSISVVVGAGGAGGARNLTGGTGSNSSLGSHTANGGGGGGSQWTESSITAGDDGGSGGGASMYHRYYNYAGSGIGISNQGDSSSLKGYGNNGGKSDYTYSASAYPGGGGGGATEKGVNGGYQKGGNGGKGLYVANIFGSSVGGDSGWFAGGGGGGIRYNGTIGYGGDGGGGNGVRWSGTGTAGSVNTGGGGGAGTGNTYSSVSAIQGGSGAVVIKYTGPQRASGGDTIYTHNGYTVHVFTSSGTFNIGNTVGDLSTTRKAALFVNMSKTNFVKQRKGFFAFDGTDEYMQLNSIPGNFSNFTVIAWFYPKSITNYENVLDCNYNVYANTGNVGPRLEISSNKQLTWVVSGNTTNNSVNDIVYSRDTNELVANQWCCAALVKNGSTLKAYFNGQLNGTASNPDGFVNSFGNLVIGKGFHLGGAERIFTGNVASVKTYTKAFTDKQIRRNFNALKGRFGL